MASFTLQEILEAWDALVTFTSYERTPKRTAWLRRSYEIQGSIDEWLENKFANVIDDYATHYKISFEAAKAALLDRPVNPWPKGL